MTCKSRNRVVRIVTADMAAVQFLLPALEKNILSRATGYPEHKGWAMETASSAKILVTSVVVRLSGL